MSKNYTGIIAELYDCCVAFSKYRNDTNYALDFYLPLISCQEINYILEIGSATGNLTLPIAATGKKIDSIDISEDMHNIIRRKIKEKNIKFEENLNLITSDILNTTFEKKYDMIVMPDNFLSAMNTYEEQIKLIQIVKSNLKKNGYLAFDVSLPNDFLINSEKYKYVTRARTLSNNIYIVECEITTNTMKQILIQNFNIDKVDKKLRVIENYKPQIVYKYLYESEIIELLNANGFEIIEMRKEIVDGIKESAFLAKLQ